MIVAMLLSTTISTYASLQAIRASYSHFIDFCLDLLIAEPALELNKNNRRATININFINAGAGGSY
jgi:hypothetical protein